MAWSFGNTSGLKVYSKLNTEFYLTYLANVRIQTFLWGKKKINKIFLKITGLHPHLLNMTLIWGVWGGRGGERETHNIVYDQRALLNLAQGSLAQAYSSWDWATLNHEGTKVWSVVSFPHRYNYIAAVLLITLLNLLQWDHCNDQQK